MLHKHTHLSKLVLFSSAPLNGLQLSRDHKRTWKPVMPLLQHFLLFSAQNSLPQVVWVHVTDVNEVRLHSLSSQSDGGSCSNHHPRAKAGPLTKGQTPSSCPPALRSMQAWVRYVICQKTVRISIIESPSVSNNELAWLVDKSRWRTLLLSMFSEVGPLYRKNNSWYTSLLC